MDTQQIAIGDIKLHVLTANSNDAGWYAQRKTFEERRSLLYPLLAAEGYASFIDIGANYGFVSMLARQALPQGRILSIEADPRLAPLIEPNFRINGLEPPEVLNLMAGADADDAAVFSLNPRSSLDNRVAMPNWSQVTVPRRAIAELLDERAVEGPVFIKIDTQGYEMNVLRGLERWLSGRGDWLIKMEFAPDWLRSQGCDPLDLLHYLSLRYRFAEFPERLRFNTPSLGSLFDKSVGAEQLPAFLAHVVAQNRNGLGWVDLLVGPGSA